jgi:hypothetical protein
MDAATAALTIAELQAEIAILQELERMAYQVRQRGEDRKWEQLRNLLQETPTCSPRTQAATAAHRSASF